MASHGAICATVLGVVAAQLGGLLLQSPMSGAAWGWKMDKPAGHFTCEGKDSTDIGCPGMGQPGFEECTAGNFTCTVVAASGYSCAPATITLACSNDDATNFDPKSGGACINIGYDGVPADSTLSWSATPNCTADNGGDDANGNGTTKTAVASGAVGHSTIAALACGAAIGFTREV